MYQHREEVMTIYDFVQQVMTLFVGPLAKGPSTGSVNRGPQLPKCVAVPRRARI
jgi:hypothetical protein